MLYGGHLKVPSQLIDESQHSLLIKIINDSQYMIVDVLLLLLILERRTLLLRLLDLANVLK